MNNNPSLIYVGKFSSKEEMDKYISNKTEEFKVFKIENLDNGGVKLWITVDEDLLDTSPNCGCCFHSFCLFGGLSCSISHDDIHKNIADKCEHYRFDLY